MDNPVFHSQDKAKELGELWDISSPGIAHMKGELSPILTLIKKNQAPFSFQIARAQGITKENQ